VKRHLAEYIYDYLPWIFKYSTDRKIRIFASLLFNCRLYQTLGKKIDKMNRNLNVLFLEQTAMKAQLAQFNTAMNEQMAQLTTLVQQLVIQSATSSTTRSSRCTFSSQQIALAALPAPETFLDIPEPHRISLADLLRLKDHSHNSGHLGVLLTPTISRTVWSQLLAQTILVLRCREAEQNTINRREEDIPATICPILIP